ncbi:hypothetical protein H0H81_012627 [Sphagnurus paluster]|uniref:Uncharacterized protein n=1 Tax=Sphagnurus paluster TaxID=117069 RepID=A0A9P7FRP9_9AGAR|nr:hypothetical protein H0H81_012627 [Sphagnurus paluster]
MDTHPDCIHPAIRGMGAFNRIAPPQFTQYDQWGRRVDELETSEGWRALQAVGQQEGILSIFYERTYGEHSRSYGFAKVMLMVADSHKIVCPLATTDGTARVIELLGSGEMKKEILPRLISRDPGFAFTSGQWMTERPGGSDVSQTETVAIPTGTTNALGPVYTLDGFKPLASTDTQVSIALARTGPLSAGSRSLSLFLIPLRLPLLRTPDAPLPPSTSNNIFTNRIRQKIGTHALPTAEISLQGTEAYLIGAPNGGVRNVTNVLNITRLWSAIISVGGLRKCLANATAYARVRAIYPGGGAGAQLLADTPLHMAHLAQVHVLYRALVHLTFGAIRLLGKVECGVASVDEEGRLRMLTPAVKAFVAEKAVGGMEEAMTALGAVGYMQENGFGTTIVDSLVEKYIFLPPAWTVLGADHDNQDMGWNDDGAITRPDKSHAGPCDTRFIYFSKYAPLALLSAALTELTSALAAPTAPLVSRPAIILVGFVAAAVFLLEHAVWAHTTSEQTREVDVDVVRRWVIEGGVGPAIEDVRRARRDTSGRASSDRDLVFGVGARAKL